MFDLMSDEQLEQLADFADSLMRKNQKNQKIRSARGILRKYADPELIPLEKTAWEQEAVENEIRFWKITFSFASTGGEYDFF